MKDEENLAMIVKFVKYYIRFYNLINPFITR